MSNKSFTKMERWTEDEKRNVLKNNSLTVRDVVANIERNDRLGFYLAYSSKNLNYSAKSSPIISLEKILNGYDNAYLISTKGEFTTVYYRLTI